ncbi:hypothetical protein [Alloactinosynnema sp. L-07]|uniref:hypothetical protein n=1 Tax=Alloactinosynnema sp. L-07 TaxID=1653480 RepID=UPI00065EF2FE|nr:hypothetical protein [Alloactinosynnema sp. L-07]CRK56552.1 hypothetical protein [Alloactinosynnema sp. L-07]
MIDADAARAAAEQRRTVASRTQPDWAAARTGEPQLVHTIDGHPSYWVCPIIDSGVLRGFVRVTADGKVAAHGTFGGAPTVVTGITADQAAEAARTWAPTGAQIGTPLYVHDGPPGREAWRVDIHEGDTTTVLMVGPGGAYEWAPRDPTLE